MLQHAAECRRMPQHLILGLVGGGFEACRSVLQHAAARGNMPQHTENSAQTKILIPSLSTCAVENDGTLVDRCSGCGIQVPDSIPRAVNTMSYRQRQQRSRLTYFPPCFFFLVVLCFDRPLLSSLCLLMSTVEPTAEGTTQPKRNKETTRGTVCSGQLEKALGSTYVVQTPRVCV